MTLNQPEPSNVLDGMRVRIVRDTDAQDLFGLITLCFAEYPGCFADPHADLADLVHPAQTAAARDQLFLVVEDDTGRVQACIAVDFPDNVTAEMHRLYVRPDARGRGLATDLIGLVEAHARARGVERIILWSDTRFLTAHALYEKRGYVRLAGSRDLGDVSGSVEWCFEKRWSSRGGPWE